jgi:lysophospholipase L1-like esterase
MASGEERVANGVSPSLLFATRLPPAPSHRPIGPHLRRHVDAELDLADRLDDVVAEQLGEAGIAPIVHVQAVGDDKAVDRQRLLLVPVAHHLKAREHADMAEMSDPAKQSDDPARALRVLGHARRILRIDQHHIAARGLDAHDAILDLICRDVGIEVAQHGIGADLPDHKVGVTVDHGTLQPLHHLRRILPADAGIDDGDVGGRIMPLQLRRQYPTANISVINAGVGGEDAPEMMKRLQKSVIDTHPDLVIWQVGTNAVLRNLDPADTVNLVEEGVARIQAAGSDVVLVDPQYSPRVTEHPESTGRIVGLLRRVASLRHVGIFPRFEVMRDWHEKQDLPIDSFVIADGLHMNDWGYACFAQLLGDDIIRSVGQIRIGNNVPAAVLTYRPM